MTTQDIINCCPFRLAQPRPLTQWEWSLLHVEMRNSIATVWLGPQPQFLSQAAVQQAMTAADAEAGMLVQSMASQPCAQWRTSAFGPAPAVAWFWYTCFANWYAGFNAAGRANVRADMAQGLLCRPGPAPWAENCKPRSTTASGRPIPLEVQESWSHATAWEGTFQTEPFIAVGGAPAAPPSVPAWADPCAATRRQTCYVPVKGRDLLALMKLAKIPVPPMLDQAPPTLFLDREFLLGVRLKEQSEDPSLGCPKGWLRDAAGTCFDPANCSPGTVAIPGEGCVNEQLAQTRLVAIWAKALLEDVVLIWAPGQGESVLWMATSPFDQARFLALMAKLVPALGGLLPQLMGPGIPWPLPGLQLPGVPGLPGLLGGQGLPDPWGAWNQLLSANGFPAQGASGLGALAKTVFGRPGTGRTGLAIVDTPRNQLRSGPRPPLPTPDGAASTTTTPTAVWVGVGAAVLVVAALLWWRER